MDGVDGVDEQREAMASHGVVLTMLLLDEQTLDSGPISGTGSSIPSANIC